MTEAAEKEDRAYSPFTEDVAPKLVLVDEIANRFRRNPVVPYLYPRSRVLVINENHYMGIATDLGSKDIQYTFPSFRLQGYITNYEDEVKKACLKVGVVVGDVRPIIGQSVGQGVDSISSLTKYRQMTQEVELAQCSGYIDFWYVARFQSVISESEATEEQRRAAKFWLPFNEMVSMLARVLPEEELPSVLLAMLDTHKQFTAPKFP